MVEPYVVCGSGTGGSSVMPVMLYVAAVCDDKGRLGTTDVTLPVPVGD